MHLSSVQDHPLELVAESLTRGFADYFQPIRFTPAGLLQMVRRDSVDLTASRVISLAGAPSGVALIARRGWTSRLAGMAIVPEARRQGLGRALVSRLLEEAVERGERAVVLEVVETNSAAVALYEAHGFRSLRCLVGLEGEINPPAPSTARQPEEVDPHEVAAALLRMHSSHHDLPWQLSAETLATFTAPARGFRLGAVFKMKVQSFSQTKMQARESMAAKVA